MFFSNLFFLVFRLLVRKEGVRLLDLNWWTGLFTLRTEYSISGVLLPISLFLFSIPLLAKFQKRYGLASLAVLSVFMALFLSNASQTWGARLSGSHFFDLLFIHGLSGVPLIPPLGSGALGFTLGLAWKKYRPENQTRFWAFLIAAYLLLSWDGALGNDAVVGKMPPALLNLVRFAVLIAIGTQVLRLPALRGFAQWFSILGKYSLCCFIAHRLIIQSIAVLWTTLPVVPEQNNRYLILAAAALAISTGICLLRERSRLVQQALKLLYL
jgi:hypothetical protein